MYGHTHKHIQIELYSANDAVKGNNIYKYRWL